LLHKKGEKRISLKKAGKSSIILSTANQKGYADVLGRTMQNSDKMTVGITFTVGELWEAVFGSDGAGMVHWSTEIRNENGEDIDLWIDDANGESVTNPQNFRVYEDEEEKWHDLSLEQLRVGFEKALMDNASHCGGYALKLDDYDACFGDIVIQYAVFGELIYG
jgi:hypothetical protein